MTQEGAPKSKSRPGGELQSFSLDSGSVHETRLDGRHPASKRPDALAPGAIGRLLNDPLSRGRIRDFDREWSAERSAAWCEADQHRYLQSRLDTWQLDARNLDTRRWYKLDAPPFSPDEPVHPDGPDGPSTESDWIEARLLDRIDGGIQPVSGAVVEVRDSMGEVYENTTNADGVARIDSLARGRVLIKFPDHDQGDWHDEGVAPGEDAFETFLEGVLVDEKGNQALSGRYEIELPEGGKLEGQIENGRLAVDGLDIPGRAKLALFDVVFEAGAVLPDKPSDPFDPNAAPSSDTDTNFVELELLDHGGAPVPGVALRLVLENGQEHEGQTDSEGLFRVELEEKDVSYQVFFTNFKDLA